MHRHSLAALVLVLLAPASLAQTSGRATENTNLRASMSAQGRVLAVIPKGTLLALANCTPLWCATTYKNEAGYVSRSLLSTGVATSAPKAAPADVFYANCAAARAAGAAPIRVGEPGYRPKLDRDGDGVACE